MFFLGSAYPIGKFGLNASINPIMFGALRMVIVFLCLIPFCKIKIPSTLYWSIYFFSVPLALANPCASKSSPISLNLSSEKCLLGGLKFLT